MARNVEIKARVSDPRAVEASARALADQGPFELAQDDTFFTCESGRLKLRELAPDQGQLIFYRRPDQTGPKLSRYFIAPVSDPAALRDVLGRALPVVGRVRKRRRLYLAGNTRIHLDQVEGLGTFLELEVVLDDGDSETDGERTARSLMQKLGVTDDDLVEGAYLDLMGGASPP